MALAMRLPGVPRLPATAAIFLRFVFVVLMASTPRHAFAKPNPHPSEQAGFRFDELFARYDCTGTTCGYYGQLCCPAGQACYTDAANQAACTASVVAATATTAGGGTSSGYWQYYTTTYTQTDLKTITSVMSTYIAGASPAASTGTAACNYALNETPCGSICCASNQYCYQVNQCAPAPNGGSTGGFYSTGTGATQTQTPGAPLRPTSSGVTTTTATASPTTTVPFVPPVATGANVTVTGAESSGGGGLSGGAIAGIVIGVLAGLLLLGLILFCCCVRGLIDGCLACFGLGGGRRRRDRTEVDEYVRYSHSARRDGRTTERVTTPWYAIGRRRRDDGRRQEERKESHELRNTVGILAGLGALWAILGLKRRHERERREKVARYPESEATYETYSYYTSAESESTAPRDVRRERSVSRR